ncbi:MAG: GNAT family N-acetyltransferase [Anaeroplasmataceae bacterium]|nr:GNAT family N-acetyltransferase [Anaeroplasmataceae bacterium]
MIFETERLYLRELNQNDYIALCKILKDEEVMYAYEGAFSDEEVQIWLDRQIQRYALYGFGLWAVILKENHELIGQCGLTMQPWREEEVLEIGYLFQKKYWHKGYAIEAAKECKKYAFQVLNAEYVCSIIRDTNIASQRVAIKNGMIKKDTWIKHYRGIDMLHYQYICKNQNKN